MAVQPSEADIVPLASTAPMPPALPFVGHLHRIARDGLIGHLLAVSRDFPEGLFRLRFGRRNSLFVTDPDLVAELSDETRFRKVPGPALRVVRRFAGDGLFTAFGDEPNWGRAHRILLPAFSQRAMRGYFDMIVDVCDQLVAKWTRVAGGEVHVADDMTRLTLDSIAVAGFGHRFNSFARDELDPFLQALGRALAEALNTITRLPVQQRFAKRAQAGYEADIARMNALVDGIIAGRRAAPAATPDLLNLMLTAEDPVTGERLDDVNIRYQVLTFLIAGHETTSGMLTFALAYLLREPAILAQAYAEVDRVLPGDRRPEYADVAKLSLIERVLKEALRLWPTAPAYTLAPYADEVVGGRWRLKADAQVNVFTPGLHRNPRVWDRPDEFDPDRWLLEREAALHPHAYKPFGNGERACIGRQFAMVEAKIAMAMLLRRFAIGDPSGYRLRIKETLSIKPDAFTMRVRLRGEHERLTPAPAAAAGAEMRPTAVSGTGRRLALLYGSTLGTARDVAEEIAERGRADGFDAVTHSLDEVLAAGIPPEDRVVVVVTATYNGRAPDSATAVERLLDQAGDGAATGERDWSAARFAVLGIGNSQWPAYQAFPKRVDAALEAAGAVRLLPRGEADGQGDFDGAVAAFVRDLWATLGAEAGDAPAEPALVVRLLDADETRASALPADARPMRVLLNEELVRPPAPDLWDFSKEAPRGSTRLIRLELPEGATYAAGDHVAVYARNRPGLVDRALARLGVAGEALLALEGPAGNRLRHLPLGRTVSARQLLTDHVELSDPLPRRALAVAAEHSSCPHTLARLARLGDGDWQAEVADKRLTLLDLLDHFPAVDMPLSTFLELSSAVTPRFYSVASSPMARPDAADLIVGTSAAPAWSGLGEHRGFASEHMASAAVGATVYGHVRRPNLNFAPPDDPSLPLAMIGAGTGFAPFRGFLEERALRRGRGEAVGEALLFYGCRHPDHDWLCRDAVERWATDGLVTPFPAFSAVAGHPHRFVQDALWAERGRLWDAITAGGAVYLCGDGRHMAPAVRDALVRLGDERTGDGSAWLEELIATGRFRQDVFGPG